MSRLAAVLIACTLWSSVSTAADLQNSLKTLNSIEKGGKGNAPAMLAWRAVGAAPVESLPQLLKAIDDKKTLAANWIRAAVDQIAERAVENGRPLPNQQLESITFDESYSPRARRLAYEWLLRVDPVAEKRIIPQMLNSSSLEMRRDAVALALKKASEATGADAKSKYQAALSAARDPDQIDAAYDKLKELGVEVDLPRHFGFITRWKLIGPFDNSDGIGFDKVYPPETSLDLTAKYRGKTDEVEWISYDQSDKYGMIDLNTALSKHMGAAGYAFAEFTCPQEMEVDLRLGCICAAKVWLNGKLMMSHEVYHSGTKIDQYVTQGQMKKGKNALLLKICQNEQTEGWAQDWEFQFRICDNLGTAVLSEGR